MPKPAPPLAPETPLVDPTSRSAFISHSHFEKATAGHLKGVLRSLGFDGFIAHEDLEPNDEWQAEIIRHLRDCRVLIVLASDKARDSVWVNQEIGAAVARGIPTVSVNLGVAPFGFLYRFQAARWTNPLTTDPTKERHFQEGNVPEIQRAFEKASISTKDHLIEGLGGCWSFEEARVVAQLIAKAGDLDVAQALRLVHLANINPSISGCWEAQRILPSLVAPHVRSVPPALVAKLDTAGFQIRKTGAK